MLLLEKVILVSRRKRLFDFFKGDFVILKDFYGSFEVVEPVLLDLIESQPVQRLKSVSHQGIIKPAKLFYSRFEHSIGVMLLLRKFGAGLEEQVAGLLHDVSHTAFSHSSDMLFGSYEIQGFQDSIQAKKVESGVVSEILLRNGFDPARIGLPELFPLLEREAPDLCADRLDYSFRDMTALGVDVSPVLKHLIIFREEFVFDSKQWAGFYARNYVSLQMEHYASLNDMTKVKILMTALQIALNRGIITREDVIGGVDEEVINKINASGDEDSWNLIDSLKKGDYNVLSGGDVVLKAKFRFVDPKFVENGGLLRLSEVDSSYKKLLESDRKKCSEGFKVNIIVGGKSLPST